MDLSSMKQIHENVSVNLVSMLKLRQLCSNEWVFVHKYWMPILSALIFQLLERIFYTFVTSQKIVRWHMASTILVKPFRRQVALATKWEEIRMKDDRLITWNVLVWIEPSLGSHSTFGRWSRLPWSIDIYTLCLLWCSGEIWQKYRKYSCGAYCQS